MLIFDGHEIREFVYDNNEGFDSPDLLRQWQNSERSGKSHPTQNGRILFLDNITPKIRAYDV